MSALIGGIGGAIVGGAVISGGLGIGGAVIGGNAAKGAADTQAAAANHAADLQNQQFEEQRQDQEPWRAAGAAALPGLSAMAASPVSFTAQDFQNNMDPGYQFNLQQGQQAIERSAAARGGLMSGGTLKDLSSYSQGMASNEYQNAYSRFMNNQNTRFNRLASVAGIGQTANAQIGAAGTATANNVGNIMTGNANAQAASQIAQGNMWGNTLSGIGQGVGKGMTDYASMTNMNNWMNKLTPQQPQTSSGRWWQDY